MPELANLSLPSPILSLSNCSNNLNQPLPQLQQSPRSDFNSRSSSQTLALGHDSDRDFRFPVKGDGVDEGGESEPRVLKRARGSVDLVRKRAGADKSFQDRIKDPSSLPFLVGAPKEVDCSFCQRFVNPGEEISCSVRGCGTCYHKECAKEAGGILNKNKFKCPQHACFLCKQKLHLLRCVRCTMAFHHKCAPWPDEVVHLKDHPGQAVCWKHPSDWRLDRKPEASTSAIPDLPLPYIKEEFKIDLTWKDMDSKMEPPPYIHIRRNIYLVKKKRSDADDGEGCTSCSSTCSDDCVCRVQCISCSKACRCSENCNNRPFRKEKRIKLVKTELCGWGVEAVEAVDKGGFIIEYIGEVIDDALCEKRLWDMKDKNVQNFYMCEIRKDFTIDATFKGNTSRFLNHSCDPNCVLEKWQVDGETRVGVFAARSIEIGEPLTYDYRFVQFGPEVKCHCGAANCQGFLGTKKKIGKVEIELHWGSKRKRLSKVYVKKTTGE
ncbi:PREDICTED: histone-lysine N-methyltransferase ASHR3 [Lupinus angustifolius]|uniref:histone-lysine N-methyltransferase ASHR3 n=1 Tax=Lupinus angustifolius TaxID=3871 RepID=UPI00092E723B|nr:PREDICTED: histone-lysine N-methyltransferase ASHR3 [Lupinus angustifolius]